MTMTPTAMACGVPTPTHVMRTARAPAAVAPATGTKAARNVRTVREAASGVPTTTSVSPMAAASTAPTLTDART